MYSQADSLYGTRDHQGPYQPGQTVIYTRADGTRRDARVIASHSKSTVIADGTRFTKLNRDLAPVQVQS